MAPVLHLQETLPLLIGQLTEEVAQGLHSHIITVEIEAQTGVGGPQMLGDQVVDSSLHLSGIILMNLELVVAWQ